jgi:hypothetical protein
MDGWLARFLIFLVVLSSSLLTRAYFCQYYEKKIQQEFQRKKITAIDEQKGHLAEQTAQLLHALGKEPTSQELKVRLLCSYNYMRKLYNLPQASSLEEIDKAWLQEVYYHWWKREELKKSSAQKQTLPELLETLTDMVSDDLATPQEQRDPGAVLYPYNMLRDVLGDPRASSLEEVNTAWVDKIAHEAGLEVLIEKGHTAPTPAQKKLIENAIAQLELEIPVVPLAHPEEKEGASGLLGSKTYISLCKDLDLDTRLSTLYHELGHIQHKDIEHSTAVRLGNETISSIRTEKHFAADLKDIHNYLELGWKVVPSLQNTTVGRHLYKVLDYDNPQSPASMVRKKLGALWNPPKDNEAREESGYHREREERADLFALRHLYKQGYVSAILASIWEYGMSDLSYRDKPYVIAQGEVNHPSDVERALYMIGFLVAHGVAVPRQLYDWETQGTCTPAEEAQKAWVGQGQM